MRCPVGESGQYRETGNFHEIRSTTDKKGGPRSYKHGALDVTMDGCDPVITASAYGEVSDIQKFRKEVELESGRFIGSYGYMVELWHPEDNSYSKYAHMKAGSLKVSERGQRVEKGEIIGLEGSTGRSTGPHLHYERSRSRKNDPVYLGQHGVASRYRSNAALEINPFIKNLFSDVEFNKVLNATALHKPWLNAGALKADVALRGLSDQLITFKMGESLGYSGADVMAASPEEQLYMLIDYYEKQFSTYGFDLSFERPEEDYVVIQLPFSEAAKLTRVRNGNEVVYGRKMTENYSAMDIDQNGRVDLREVTSYMRWAVSKVQEIPLQKVDN